MEGLRSMLKIRNKSESHPVSALWDIIIPVLSFSEGILSPYILWLKFRALVQLERITFRAVYLLCKLFFFDYSESDTFLRNYSTAFKSTKEQRKVI